MLLKLLNLPSVKFVRKHLPWLVGVALVVVNALIASHDLTLSAHTTNLVNSILAGLGLGELASR